MPTRSVIDLVDSAVHDHDARRGAEGGAARAQAAFVRALVDEVARHSPADLHVAALHEQLGDELALLAELIERRVAEAPPEGARGPAHGWGGPPSVLVVDDDDDSRRATIAALRALGYPCRAVADAEEALREHERDPTDIVLSDCCMPAMSGFELCAALKQRDPRAYVILASGLEESARVLDGGRSGADAFVQKPLDLDALEARLSAATRLIGAVRTVAEIDARLRATARG